MNKTEQKAFKDGFEAGLKGENSIVINGHRVTYHDQTEALWVISIDDGERFRFNPHTGYTFSMEYIPLYKHGDELLGLR